MLKNNCQHCSVFLLFTTFFCASVCRCCWVDPICPVRMTQTTSLRLPGEHTATATATATRWNSWTYRVRRGRRPQALKFTPRCHDLCCLPHFGLSPIFKLYLKGDCLIDCLFRTMTWTAVNWIPPMMRKSGTATAQGISVEFFSTCLHHWIQIPESLKLRQKT